MWKGGIPDLHNEKVIEVSDNDTNVRRLDMYCVFEMIEYPEYGAPFIESCDVFSSMDEANAKVEKLVDVFLDEYDGEVYIESEPNGPIRVITNGDVTSFIYLQEC